MTESLPKVRISSPQMFVNMNRLAGFICYWAQNELTCCLKKMWQHYCCSFDPLIFSKGRDTQRFDMIPSQS